MKRMDHNSFFSFFFLCTLFQNSTQLDQPSIVLFFIIIIIIIIIHSQPFKL